MSISNFGFSPPLDSVSWFTWYFLIECQTLHINVLHDVSFLHRGSALTSERQLVWRQLASVHSGTEQTQGWVRCLVHL